MGAAGLIPPSGPPDAPGLLVGEAGGANEHRLHRPFCGKAGDVLNANLLAASTPRGTVRVTNIFPFWTGDGNPDPTPAQIAAEEWRLEEEISRLKPLVIGALGAVATRWFLDATTDDTDLEVVHGVPHFSPRAPLSIIIPCYHPAAGFYSPDKAAFAQDDIFRFAYYLQHPTDISKQRAPKIKIVYHEKAPAVIRDAAVDTEGLEDRPWGMSWSYDGKTAHVWVYGKGKRPPRLEGRILCHNALHDLKILRAMGIDTTTFTYDDSMVTAFDLQLEPQGLKPLALRHLNLKMTDFGSTVRPWFNKEAVAWMRRAAKHEYAKPEEQIVPDPKRRCWKPYRPQDAGRRIASILKSWEKKPADTKLEKRWEKLGGEFQRQAEEAVGSAFPEFAVFSMPLKRAVKYSGTDAAATSLIFPKLKAMVKEKDLDGVYEMDRAALPFVDRMQEVGMAVDVDALAELEAEVLEKRTRSHKRVCGVVGDRWFNPGSDDQVAEWLYEMKGLVPLAWTESGKRGSTKDEDLAILRGTYSDDEDIVEFTTALQDYREADKLEGTFISPIFAKLRGGADLNHQRFRLHPNFRVTRVVSGRLSSHEPNVLAMPTRSELGLRIRKCFAAEPGWAVLGADLSQIELRTGAHFSRDPRMMAAFRGGEDLHALTARTIFKIPASKEVPKSQRYVAKTINFAVFYGITARALQAQLWKAGIFDYTLEDCEKFIAQWFAIYTGVRPWQNRLWAQAAKDGFVRDMWGRLCYVPNLRVLDQSLREAAQRLAGNMPIQSSASGLVKRAETALHSWLETTGMREVARPWLQMHDELILEVREDVVEEVKEKVVGFMVQDQDRFRVPIKAESGYGRSWGDAKAA